MIKLDNVKSNYDDLNINYDLHIKPNEKVAIIGESGAGKTTLLNIIAGFQHIENGKLYLDGVDCTKLPVNKRPVSFIFQSNNLFPNLTIFENLSLVYSTLRISEEQRNNIIAITKEVNIDHLLNKKPESLSGGQQQRASIAKVLLLRRPILLMDEPFSALDHKTMEKSYQITRDIINQYKMTTLIVTHHLNQIEQDIDKVIEIKNCNIDIINNIG